VSKWVRFVHGMMGGGLPPPVPLNSMMMISIYRSARGVACYNDE